MSYQPDHPIVTGTIRRFAVAEIPGSGGKQRKTEVSPGPGTVTGGYEDLSAGELVAHTDDGKAIVLSGRLYADRAQDKPVLRGDHLLFTDPATGEARTLEVVGRRGPFDATDPEDHFELDLASEQAARAGRAA